MAIAGFTRLFRLATVIVLPMTVVACGLFLDDDDRIERASAELENGEYAAAIIAMKNVLQKSPDNAAARQVLGRALVVSGEYEAAQIQLERALEQGEPLDGFRVALLRARLANDQPEQALAIADPAAAADDEQAFRLWLYRGDAQAELEAIADALRSYENAGHLGIDKPKALLRAANLYKDAGNFRDARAFAELAIENDSGEIDARLLLADILVESGDAPGAVDTLTRALTDLRTGSTDSGYVFAALARVHLAQGDIEAAKEAARRVAESWSADDLDLRYLNGRIALVEGDNESAVTEMSAYLAEYPYSATAARTLAAAQLGQGSVNQATDRLARALAANPDDNKTRQLLARVYLAEGQLGRARAVVGPALDLAPQDPGVLSLLGILDLPKMEAGLTDERFTLARDELIRGEIGQALAIAKGAARDHKDDARAWSLLGLCQLADGQPQLALESFSQALVIEPGSSSHRLNIARAHLGNSTPEQGLRVLEELAAKDFDSGVSDLRRALVVNLHESNIASGRPSLALLSDWLGENPDDARVRELLAEAQLDQNLFADAAENYEFLIRQQRGVAVFYNNLAWSYVQLGDDRAAASAQEALQLAPNNGGIMDTLGWIYVVGGRADKAESLLRDAHVLRPGDPEIAYHLAYTLSQTGAQDEAVEMLSELLARPQGSISELARALLSRIQQPDSTGS